MFVVSHRTVAPLSLTRAIVRLLSARAASPEAPHTYHVLEYTYAGRDVEEMKKLRLPLRSIHLAHAEQSRRKGQLVLGGAFGDFQPASGGLLIFRGCEMGDVEAFAKSDPYVTQKLVTSWKVRPWTVVLDAMREPL